MCSPEYGAPSEVEGGDASTGDDEACNQEVRDEAKYSRPEDCARNGTESKAFCVGVAHINRSHF
jgi:hypothetical protein